MLFRYVKSCKYLSDKLALTAFDDFNDSSDRAVIFAVILAPRRQYLNFYQIAVYGVVGKFFGNKY